MLLPLLLCILILYLPVGATGAVLPLPVTVLGVAVLAAANVLLGLAGTRLTLRMQAADARAGDLAAARVFALLKGCLVGFVLADVLVFDWPAVPGMLGEIHPALVLVDDLLLLLPALVMILSLMACRYGVEARRRPPGLSPGRYLRLRFRIELAVVLAPWLLLVLAGDVAFLLFGGSPSEGAAVGLATGGMVVLILVFSPALIRFVWRTSPLEPGPLRRRLNEFCRAHGFRHNGVLLWHTHNHLANAGVVGPTPLMRHVVLSDALVGNCTPAEIEAVFAREVGHVRRRHMAFYVLVVLGFACFYANLLDLLAPTGWVGPPRDILALAADTRQGLVMVAFAALYWGVGFGVLSRRMEQEADLFALRTTADPSAFRSALARLAAINHISPHTPSWRHFSIARRIDFLRRAEADPGAARAFQKRLLALKAAFVLLLTAGTARLLLVRPELLGL